MNEMIKPLIYALHDLELVYRIEAEDLITIPSLDIEIHTSTDYWRYPGITSYFVNYIKDSNNFSLHPGETNLFKVVYLIGQLSMKEKEDEKDS